MSSIIPSFNVGRPFWFMEVGSPSERLHNLQPKRHWLCMHMPKQIIYYLYRILLRPDIWYQIDSEVTSNRCNHIWLCNGSLDGDTFKFQNGVRPSDVAQLYSGSVESVTSIAILQTCRAQSAADCIEAGSENQWVWRHKEAPWSVLCVWACAVESAAVLWQSSRRWLQPAKK